MENKKDLTTNEQKELLNLLKIRFEKNLKRHNGIEWAKVQEKLEKSAEKLWSLQQMEKTGGEPDVVMFDEKTGEYTFVDCSPESPSARRSLCYDKAAWESRKEFKPKDTVLDMAKAMGIELLTEDEYRHLQTLGNFDTKTSSWVQTPNAIRNLGGAIFLDRRYNHVFMYHNGAESYYAVRGFRGKLQV
jgi:hypothetical protein